jgi:CheY-like chemotaxis protein
MKTPATIDPLEITEKDKQIIHHGLGALDDLFETVNDNKNIFYPASRRRSPSNMKNLVKVDTKIAMSDCYRILLVDDEPDISLVFRTVLEDEGFTVDSFEDPLLALSKFKPNFYNLAILDIKMPGINGFQLYREIKKIDPKVKVCFLTASEMYYENYRKKEAAAEAAENIAALDKDLFLLKPLSNEDLVQRIYKIIRSN